MRKFVKKPVIIEAVQVPNDYDEACKIQQWMIENGDTDVELVMTGDTGMKCYLRITTLEGKMRAKPGDWVIRGVQGEFYPCKPDIFEQTYEEVKSE